MNKDNNQETVETPKIRMTYYKGKDEEEKEREPSRTLVVSDKVNSISRSLYGVLMALESGGQEENANQFAGNIDNFINNMQSDRFKSWGVSTSGKRLKCYEFDGPDDPKDKWDMDEWLEKIKSDLCSAERIKYSEMIDSDVEWWNGLTEDEKLAVFTVDLEVWNTMFVEYKDKNRPEYNYQTTDYVKTWLPCFGNPDNPNYQPENLFRPLPIELVNAVCIYIVGRWFDEEDNTDLIREIRGVGNFNTFIREEMEKGKL